MESTLKIKDFIIDINKTKEPSIVNKKSTAPKVEYSIVLENDMDFVIKRKTAKTDKDLVFLVSQDLFYIKNNIDETVVQLDRDNYKRQISTFLRDMGMWLNFEKVTWTENCYTENLYNMFVDNVKRTLLKHGIDMKNSYYREYVAKALKANPKIVKYWFNKFEDIDRSMLDTILYINNEYDFNNSKYLIDTLDDMRRSSIGGNCSDKIFSLAKEFNCNTNTAIDYIVRGLYSQGINYIGNDIYNYYKDYLHMTQEMKGKIKNKYPKNLKTEHDKVAMRYNIWRKYKDDLAVLKTTDENKKLEYTGREYSVILPETSSDIVDEGINQSHCVASYVKNVVNGDTLILFMRYTNILEDSLVTLEVKNNAICQARGYANRNLTRDEKEFVKRWAKIKELEISCGGF